MINILIVDDHAIVREGLNRIIAAEKDMKVAGMAKDGNEVIRIMLESDIDVVVLDISMPGKSGLDLIKDLKQVQPMVKILMLSMYPEERFAMRSIKAGASGYLTKEMAPEEIVNAIRTIYSGRKYITPALADIIAEELQNPSEKVPHELLSDREFEVLCMLAIGKPVVEIAASLSLSESTVSTYRMRILQKMGLKTNSDLIHYGIEHGLVE
ncbi:MAG TPA: response regulator transcription factor [Bacteroidales bacterium]|nr:response regulator transcription factor [Bacteroidales bacterium]